MRDFEERRGKNVQKSGKEVGQNHPWLLPPNKKKISKKPALTSTDKASNGERTSTVTDGEAG